MPKKKHEKNSQSLDGKIIRPGTFNYAYYLSDRRLEPAAEQPDASPKPVRARRSGPSKLLTLLGLILLAGGLIFAVSHHYAARPSQPVRKAAPSVHRAPVQPAVTQCTPNKLSQIVFVSVSQRKLWACGGSKLLYQSPVVTGYEGDPSDATPLGTYQIFTKESNVTLTGSDNLGSWSDPVSYWMPFLFNQYGAYGFHDATWRADSAFGNIDPASPSASHGCVELPLPTAKWLYSWIQDGTSVTIES
jgi:lipoprotein-anchoring transpeptidase ErfK/SrfK